MLTCRLIKMALVHDLAECLVGDITPFCGVSREEKHKREVVSGHSAPYHCSWS